MVGRTVHQYQFLEKLGSGGMGEIYKAQDTRLNRFVAIKVLTSDTAGDPERRRRFLQEAQAASALNHPNIITIHDIASEGDAQFMVMENVQGKTLADLIPKGGLRVPQVLKFCVQMADALAAAHNAGIIHRDLKPGNVMVTETGLVKILDFGLAKLTDRTPLGGGIADDATRTIADAPLTVEGAIIGTVSYMSPEQAQGRKIDQRSDIFSLGLVIYEMVTGTRAFHGDSALSTLSAILRDDPRPVHEIAPEVPSELEQVIARCLSKNPDNRWQNMIDLQRALAALKHESDSGVLYRSRLSSTSVPVTFPASGVQSGINSQIVTGQHPSSQASVNWSQTPAAGAPPSQASQQHQPTPPASQQSVRPLTQPPPQPGAAAQKSPASGPNKGLILALAGGALVLVAGGAGWWMVNRSAPVDEPQAANEIAKAEEPVAIPEPLVTPAESPATATKAPETKAVETKAPEAKAADAKSDPKSKDTKQAAPAPPPVPAVKSVAAQKSAPPAAPPVVANREAPPAVEIPRATPPPAASRNTVGVTVTDGRPFMVSLTADVRNDADEGAPLRFTAKDDLKVGDVVVIPRGAAVTGMIVSGGKKRIIGSTKMTLRLIDAESNGGGKIRLRSLPGRRPDGNYERPVDTGVKKGKELAAAAGTEYVAYIDSDQTLNVRK